MPDHLLNVDEAADYLGISRASLYARMGKDGLPSVKVGRNRRLRPQDIDAWLTSRVTSQVKETA